MAETQREIETKFDVAPDFDLGDPAKLADPAEPGATVQTSTVELVSTYYDTPDQALLRSYLTLRRRVGDDDTGWQLKVPGAGFRTELRWPLAAGPDEAEELPDELRELLGPWLGSAQVRALATVRVTRTRYRLLEGGRRVLEVADDEVRASSTAGDSGSKRWRELEVEFGPAGSAAQADRVAALLTDRGALPSRSASKLERAVRGESRPDPEPGTAAAVLAEYLRAQCDALTSGHFAVALKPFEPTGDAEPHEAVHQTRVATRRLRATLRTFAELFDDARATRLDAELASFAVELGEVRDREVLRARLHRAVTELPEELIIGPVGQRIEAVLSAELEERAQALQAGMHTRRYAELMADLADWRTSPPLTALADRPAPSLADYVAKSEHQLAKRLKLAAQANALDDNAPDELLHSARKAGKRARYGAEAAVPALGKRAHRLAKTAEKLQSLLGEHQDAVVTIELLRRIAAQVAAEGANAFSYGVLVGEQRRIAAETAQAARSAAHH